MSVVLLPASIDNGQGAIYADSQAIYKHFTVGYDEFISHLCCANYVIIQMPLFLCTFLSVLLNFPKIFGKMNFYRENRVTYFFFKLKPYKCLYGRNDNKFLLLLT